MSIVTSRYYKASELKTHFSDKLLLSMTHVRIRFNVAIFRELDNEWEHMVFVHRAELPRALFIETFWEQIRFLVKDVYERCDRLYGLSYLKHFHDFDLQPEFQAIF